MKISPNARSKGWDLKAYLTWGFTLD